MADNIAELKESEARYKALFDRTILLICVVDFQGNFLDANEALLKLLGYTREEIPSLHLYTILDKDQLPIALKATGEVLKNGFLRNPVEIKLRKKNGHYVWVEAEASLIYRDETPYSILGIANDITERKKMEEALRTEKERFQTLTENAPFGMVMIDKDGTFKYINSKFKELFGYDLKDVPNGRTWFKKAYPVRSYRHRVFSTWIDDSKSFEPGEKIPRTFTVTCKDGTEKVIRFITEQLESGEYLMGTEDITLLKRAETEKADLEEQLRQSQRIEAVGRLAGGIAHDFNNLMMVIRGYSQLSLAEIKEGDKLRGNLEEIRKATERATDLTRQLLAFSRRQILEFKVLDLSNLIRDMERMLRRVIGEDIELVTYHAEDLGRVKTDPGQIEQVIMNLAVNARDSMPDGGKLIIETRNVELDEDYTRTHVGVKPGRYVMFSLSDTGVGMSPEVKEHIFEPFFTTKEISKGTGLGLSTVYGIVKQCGGNIWFYSELRKGTTFKVFLPRVDEPLEEIRESTVSKEIPSGRETILAVEDEDNVRKLTVQILKGQGYSVLEASHAEEAMKVVREQTGNGIHLLLTDVVMPGMSGHELANHLISLLPKIKVLFMSGYTDNAIVHHGVLEEGVNYIQKPFTVDALARKVREVLDR